MKIIRLGLLSVSRDAETIKGGACSIEFVFDILKDKTKNNKYFWLILY
jgi:hypothetical protein